MAIKLKPHQTQAVREMHNGCVLTGGVGTGKTITSLAYFVAREAQGGFRFNGVGDFTPYKTPKDIYVITTARKRDELDWQKEAGQFGIFTDPKDSFGGIKLTVDSWNQVHKYSEVKDAFFIFDEQRVVGSGKWTKAFIAIAKQNRWILLSATPGDTWMDYIPLFVANGFYKHRTEFVQEHVIFNYHSKYPKVDGYRGQRTLAAYRDKILVEMPFERHTKRHIHYEIVDHNKAVYDEAWKKRWHIEEQRPLRDAAELYAQARKIVNSDVSRLGAVMRIHEKHPRLIIFYNFDYELFMLRTLSTTLDVTMAEWNGHKHEPIPEGDKWLYLVQYSAGAEAWNCISTDAIAYFSLNYSYRMKEQTMGRIDRMNTPYVDLHYYFIRSTAAIDQGILQAVNAKQDFNEKDFLRKHS